MQNVLALVKIELRGAKALKVFLRIVVDVVWTNAWQPFIKTY